MDGVCISTLGTLSPSPSLKWNFQALILAAPHLLNICLRQERVLFKKALNLRSWSERGLPRRRFLICACFLPELGISGRELARDMEGRRGGTGRHPFFTPGRAIPSLPSDKRIPVFWKAIPFFCLRHGEQGGPKILRRDRILPIKKYAFM